MFSATLDTLLAPFRRPDDLVIRNPIVRLAGQGPASDRRRKRNAFAVESQLPVGRTDRRHDLIPAATAAAVHRRGVLDGYIDNTVLP